MVVRSHWRLIDRQRFLDALAEHGDALKAVKTIGRPLQQAYALRSADAAFLQKWTQAIAIAWDRVEARLLERLLAAPECDANDAPAVARLLDTKLVLALVQKRIDAVHHRSGLTGFTIPSDPRTEKLRAEIRALGGALPEDWQPE